MMLIGAGDSRFFGVVLPLPFPVTTAMLLDDGVDDDPAGLVILDIFSILGSLADWKTFAWGKYYKTFYGRNLRIFKIS